VHSINLKLNLNVFKFYTKHTQTKQNTHKIYTYIRNQKKYKKQKIKDALSSAANISIDFCNGGKGKSY